MSELKRVLDQSRRAFQGSAWHGASLMELLEDVDAVRATARPIPNGHTIWELTLHIAAWKDVARRRIGGERADPSEEENWPAVRDTSELAWTAARATLTRAHEELAAAVAKLDDTKLLEPVTGRGYDVYTLIHGVIQHDLYHAGQIALLKKG